MKNYFLLLILLLTLSIQSFGQNFKAKFNDLVNKKDTSAEIKLLVNWEKTNDDDPELYIAYYNYYVIKSMSEVLDMSTIQTGEKSLVLKDSKTGKIAGYINDGVTYKKSILDKGFHYIDIGIQKFPSRLDMRFGKTYMLGKIEDYDAFTQEIIKAVDYAQKINLKWTWTDNKPVDDPKNFMLGNIQSYVGQLYNLGDSQLNNMRSIAETVLKYYPDHVESLSNLSITYMIKNDFVNALPPLLKAEKIAPTDFIVLNNIAYCYNGLKDKTNTIKYYELAFKYGDERSKAFAKKRLEELQKK